MRTAIFYDTETTGLPLFKEPSEHPNQPHIVQLAAKLVDLDSRKVITTIDHTVYPDGWIIPENVAKIHGITTEHALSVGIDESDVLVSFLSLWERASIRIGHNEPFDARIVRIACMRHADQLMADKWKSGASACTQILSTPILKLPPTQKMIAAGFKKHKSANLGEAYEYFTGKKLDGAHNALVDVDACMEVYFAIQDVKLREAA
jgi:DNA polymerase-3 subunit epsilon